MGSITLMSNLRNMATHSVIAIYLFTKGKGGRKRRRETSMCGCISRALYWGPGPQPRHVLWLGIKQATFWFKGQHSIHWATPARACCVCVCMCMCMCAISLQSSGKHNTFSSHPFWTWWTPTMFCACDEYGSLLTVWKLFIEEGVDVGNCSIWWNKSTLKTPSKKGKNWFASLNPNAI